MQPWYLLAVSLFVGFISGVIGAYVGMMVGLARLEVHRDYMQKRMDGTDTRMDGMGKVSALYHEDVRVHDFELEDVMRMLDLPRKKRQNWRFES